MDRDVSLVSILGKLPHRKEVESWLVAVAAGVTGRQIPEEDPSIQPDKRSAEHVDGLDLQLTLETIRDIYREKGYRTPWQLENDIIQKIRPGIPSRALELADDRTAIERDRDDVTGYYRKTQEPMVVDLAMLYNEFTGRPVAAYLIDIQNLGSTTHYNGQLLAAAEGRAPDDYTAQEGFAITDQQIFLLSSTISERIAAGLPAGAGRQRVEVRTGGDELTIIVPDLDPERAREMIPAISRANEELTAAMGLHDHPYGKDPDNRRADGFGAGIEVVPLQADGQHQTRLDAAEHAIRAHKERLAGARRDDSSFRGMKPSPYPYERLLSDREAAAEHLAVLWARVGEMREARADMFRDLKDSPCIEETASRVYPGHLATVTALRHAIEDMLTEDLRREEIRLSPDERRLLNAKIAKFPAMDYATGTLLGSDFPALAKAAMNAVAAMNRRTKRDMPMGFFSVEFSGVGDLNREYGHVTTDRYLSHMAHGIIEPALAAAGLRDENVYLAHMGGGKFFGVHQAEIRNPDGTTDFIAERSMRIFRDEIMKRTAEMNKQGVPDHPVPVGGVRSARGGPWMDGVHAIVATGVQERLDLRGGYVVHKINQAANRAAADYKAAMKTAYEKGNAPPPGAGPAAGL